MRNWSFIGCAVALSLSACAFPLRVGGGFDGPLPSSVEELRDQLPRDSTLFVVIAQGEFDGGNWAYGGYLPSDPEQAGHVCEYAIANRIDPDGSGSSGSGGGQCAPADTFTSRASVTFTSDGPVTGIVGPDVARVQIVLDGELRDMTVVHPAGFPAGFAWIDVHGTRSGSVTEVTAWDAEGNLVCADDDPDVDPCGDFSESGAG